MAIHTPIMPQFNQTPRINEKNTLQITVAMIATIIVYFTSLAALKAFDNGPEYGWSNMMNRLCKTTSMNTYLLVSDDKENNLGVLLFLQRNSFAFSLS
jgi:hypothetical protein